MATTLSELVNDWNETMPFPIRAADIKNPTEIIFRRLLIQMLKELYVDTTCYETIDSENVAQAKASRVKLVAVVNHFYKIANPGAKDEFSFCFIDLVQPGLLISFSILFHKSKRLIFLLGFKKTRHILNYLMNYRTFIRHIYAKTILETKEKLQEIDDLRSKRKQLRKNIEEAKIKEENNIKSIKDLDARFPHQKKKIAELEEKQKSLLNAVTKIENKCEESDVKLLEVKNELSKAESLAMSDQEIESIVSAKQLVEKELEEQDQITSHGRQKLKKNSQAIEECVKITSKMESLYTSVSNIKTADLKTKSKHLDDLKVEVNQVKAVVSKDEAEIKELSQNVQFKEESIENLEKRQNEIEKSYRLKDFSQTKEIKAKKDSMRKLSAKEAAITVTNKHLLEKQRLTFQLAANVIKHISSNVYEDDSFQN